MQVLTLKRGTTLYEFFYVEKVGAILIYKDKKHAYMIRSQKNGKLQCNCPGGRFRGKCFHVNKAREVFDFSRTIKCRSFARVLQEEYFVNWHEAQQKVR